MDKKIIQKAGKYFTSDEKHKIIQELISTPCTKVEIWKKYTATARVPRVMHLISIQIEFVTANCTASNF